MLAEEFELFRLLLNIRQKGSGKVPRIRRAWEKNVTACGYVRFSSIGLNLPARIGLDFSTHAPRGLRTKKSFFISGPLVHLCP